MSFFARSSKITAHSLRLASTSVRPLRNSQLPLTRSFQTTTVKMAIETSIVKLPEFNALLASTKEAATASADSKSKSIVIVDAYADWCGPCKVIAPTFHALAEKYGDAAHFVTIDVDNSPEIAQELGIRAMPTFKIFKNGELFDSVQGAYPAKLQEAVAKVVAAA